MTKRITTPSGLMQPGMNRTALSIKQSSPHVKINGIQTTNKSYLHLPTTKKIKVNLIFVVNIKEQKVSTTCQRGKWDLNHKHMLNAPANHKKIRVNLIFAVKVKGRHKARLVVDGSLTPEPAENTYSGVVSLKHLRLVIFLGELNNLELWGADIGNAYLEAYTHKKLP